MRNRLEQRRRRGVTLMELMVAVMLMTLLSTGILFALHIGINAMQGTQRKFAANRKVLGAQRVIDQQLAGLIPVQVLCGSERSRQALFFHGTANSMRFISAYTLEEGNRSYPRVVEYMIIPGERTGVRLVMNEYLYGGPMALSQYCTGLTTDPRTLTWSAQFSPVQLGPRPFVLADQLIACRFQYLMMDGRGITKQWGSDFAGSITPVAVRIEMTPIAPDGGRLQMATTTIPIRVMRNASQFYNDIDPQPRP
jgi:prepilin-type N-terminal cleavage/methylation domain-containing protein